MGIAPMIFGVLGSAVNMVGSIMGGQAQAAQANYAAQVARNNAIIAEQNATRAISVGELKGQTQGFKTGAHIGAQKVAQAASGVDVGVGSPLQVRQSTAELGRLDALTILNQAQQQASAFRAQKMNYLAEAELQSMKGSYAKTAGLIGGIGSLIGGASSVSDKWLGYKKAGIGLYDTSG